MVAATARKGPARGTRELMPFSNMTISILLKNPPFLKMSEDA
jgi:hypothetical protein